MARRRRRRRKTRRRTRGSSRPKCAESIDFQEHNDGGGGEERDGAQKEEEFAEALRRIRERDPTIYDPDTKLYNDDDDDDEEEEEEAQSKKRKPAYLKDVLAQQALQYGAEGLVKDEEEEEERDQRDQARPKTHGEEQEDVRQEFLRAADQADEGDEALELRRKQEGQHDTMGEAVMPERAKDRLEQFFGNVSKLDEGEEFLRDYLVNQRWVDRGEREFETADESREEGLEEDAKDVERQEEFESAYNFRFEEPGATEIVAPGRNVEGSLRREENRRKRKRKQREERKAEEKRRLQEEMKRLKNLKKREIEDKLDRIRKTAGTSAAPVNYDQLEGEFDPEEHDRWMAEQFGDDFYGAEEDNPDDLREENLDPELKEVLGTGEATTNQIDQLRARIGTNREAQEEEEEKAEGPEVGEKEGMPLEEREAKGSSKFSKKRMKEWKRDLQERLKEYDTMTAEDFVAGMPTRFKYREVNKEDFGLSTEEILMLSDKELNKVVSIKKLAPYRESEGTHVSQKGLTKARRRAKEKLLELKRSPNRDEEVKEATERVQSFAKPTRKGWREAEERAERFRKELEQAKQRERHEQFKGLTKSQKKNLKRRGKLPSATPSPPE